MSSKIIDKDLGWKNIKKQLRALKDKEVASGLFGNEEKNPETNISFRGIVNEYGTESAGKNKNITIPARPFTQQAYETNKRNIYKFIDTNYSLVLTGRQTTEKMLNRLGIYHSDQIKDSITTGDFTANAPSTIARKGSSKPLIDSGEMRQKTTYVIRKRGAF